MSVVLGEGRVWAGADPGMKKRGGGHKMYCEMWGMILRGCVATEPERAKRLRGGEGGGCPPSHGRELLHFLA